MAVCNNNLNVLPFYPNKQYWHSHKWYTYGQICPVMMLNNNTIPFQLVIDKNLTVASASIKKVSDDSVVRNLTTTVITSHDEYDIIMSVGSQIESLGLGLYYYYIKLSDNSELISDIVGIIDSIDSYIKLEYWNDENLYFSGGAIDYSNNFKFTAYIKSTIGKPEYEFKEEITDRLGYKFIDSQISNKIYNFVFMANEAMCDALRLVRMSDYIKLTTNLDSYNALYFSYEPKWEDNGDIASISASFETDTIIQKLESFNRRQTADFYNALLSNIEEPILFDTEVIAQYYKDFKSVEGKLIRELGETATADDNSFIPIDLGNGPAKKIKLLSVIKSALRDYISEEDRANIIKISKLFGLDSQGNVYVKDNRSFYSYAGISAKGFSSGGGGGGGGGATTLGELANVGEWADKVPQADRVMVQLSGATHWSSKPLSEIVGLDTEALAEYLADNQYATQEWVNTKLGSYATTSAMSSALGNKVDKVAGKGLSSNDFTDALLTKLNGIEEGANKYVLPTATGSVLGGVKVGATLAIASGVLNMKVVGTAGTYTKVTVDAYGRVTGHASLAATDIPNLPWSKITSGKPTTLAGYGITDAYTKQETDTKLSAKLDKETFEELFEKVELSDGTFAIHAKFGLYSDSFLSALGMNPDGGSGGASSLSELSDVSLSGLQDGQALTWDAAAQKWMNKTLEAGLDEEALAEYLTDNQYAKKSDISIAGLTDLHSSWDALLKAAKPTTLAGYGIADGVTLSTAQTITGQKTFTNAIYSKGGGDALRVQFDVDTSRYSNMIRGYNASGTTTIFTIGYHNTVQNLILNPTGVGSDVWSDKVGNYSLIVGNNKLSYNTYDIVHMGNLSLIDSRYVLKTGDTITGNLSVMQIKIENTNEINVSDSTNSNGLYIGYRETSRGVNLCYNNAPLTYGSAKYAILHAGNYTSTLDSRYVKKAGDTMTGTLTATYFISTAPALYFGDGGYSMGRIGISSEADKALIIQAAANGGIRMSGRNNSPLTDFNVKVSSHSVATINDHVIWTAGNDGSGSGLDADLLDGVQGIKYRECAGYDNKVDINVGGDANTYYPVVIGYTSSNFPATLLNITRIYNETAPDSWNNSTHKGALTLCILWNGSRYWDGNGAGKTSVCNVIQFYQEYSTTVGGIGSSTSGLVVWLRGGGAAYHLYSNRGPSLQVTVHTSSFTDNAEQTFAPKTTPSSISEYQILNVNATSATKLQTARTIWGQSFDGRGNVDGIIAITSNGNTLRIGSQNSSWYHIYGDPEKPFIVNNKFCTEGNHDLGESNYKWHNLYLSGYAYCDGWFQNNVNGCGLYNSAQNARWYASRGCWNTDKPIIPNSDNAYSVGTSSYRFNFGYFTNMNLSGNLTAQGTIYSKIGVYSDGYVSALGNNTSSDMRLKTKLSDIALTPKDIANAPAMLFAWKKNGMKDVGSSAQYWKNVLPDAVKERDGWLEMAYGNIALVSAISIAKKVVSHEERIAQLEKENIGLKNKIKELERRIA